MTYAILTFIGLVFLSVAVICLLLSRDDPIDNDVVLLYKVEPQDTKEPKP